MPGTWRDITSYSRNDGERKPRSFEYRGAVIRFVVTRHQNFPGAWVLNSLGLGQELTQLDAADLEAAKVEALQKMAKWLRALLSDLSPEEAAP